MLRLGMHAVLAGSEPEELIAALDPPALDPDAERQNARRASITGVLAIVAGRGGAGS